MIVENLDILPYLLIAFSVWAIISGIGQLLWRFATKGDKDDV